MDEKLDLTNFIKTPRTEGILVTGNAAGKYAEKDPETSAILCRKTLDLLLQHLFEKYWKKGKPGWEKVSWNQLEEAKRENYGFIPLNIYVQNLKKVEGIEIGTQLDNIKNKGNKAVHNYGKIDEETINSLIQNLEEVFECDEIIASLNQNLSENERKHINHKEREKKRLNTQITLFEPEKWRALSKKEKFGKLCEIIKFSQIKELKFVLEEGDESIFVNEKNGNTILHYASIHGSKPEIIELCAGKIEPDRENKNEETALHLAIENGHLETVIKLIELGADPYKTNSKNVNAFQLCCMYGQPDIFKYIYEKYNSVFDIEMVDENGTSLLMYSVYSDNIELFEFLLELGADINHKSLFNCDVMFFAFTNNSRKIIKKIYSMGFKVLGKSLEVGGLKSSYLSAAMGIGDYGDDLKGIETETLKLIFELEPELIYEKNINIIEGIPSNGSLLYVSLLTKRLDITEFLYRNYNFPLDEIIVDTDELKISILQGCVMRGLKREIEFLLKLDPELTETEQNKNTLLIWAVNSGDPYFLIWIQKITNTDVNFHNSLNISCLNYAIIQEKWEMISYLISMGAEVNDFDPNGDSVLYNAMDHNMPDFIIKLLLESGADINIKNEKGFTILQCAVLYNKINIVKQLLDYGADVNITAKLDDKEATALMMAVHCGYTDIAKLILEKDCNLSVYCPPEGTVLDIAILLGNIEIIEILLEKDKSLLKQPGLKRKLKLMQKQKLINDTFNYKKLLKLF